MSKLPFSLEKQPDHSIQCSLNVSRDFAGLLSVASDMLPVIVSEAGWEDLQSGPLMQRDHAMRIIFCGAEALQGLACVCTLQVKKSLYPKFGSDEPRGV
jgi:hypothetical protein